MSVLDGFISNINEYFYISSVSVIDVIEIILIAVIFYKVMLWFKKTQAWALFKGIIIVLIVVFIADMFNFTTIIWLANKAFNVGLIALIVIFQPELRRALEQLGQSNIVRGVIRSGKSVKYITDHTQNELVEATRELSAAKTGALICIQRDVGLSEYENTGITIDSSISRQLLVNIFEDKTPLHDGAVIIVNNRIVSATCYLPMSENLTISKKYGTRHRAAVGLSEVTDAFIIVVSEETGHISLALDGELIENVSTEELKKRLIEIQMEPDDKRGPFAGRFRNKKEAK